MFELKLGSGRAQLPIERFFLLLALAIVPLLLNSCGAGSSSSSSNPPSVTVSCVANSGQGAGSQVNVGGKAQCTASVLNLSSTLVNWSVSGTGNGTIDSNGVYTAPSTQPTMNNVTITATSQVMSSVTGTATITIIKATTISAVVCVTPGTTTSPTTVSSGNQLDCTATPSTGTTAVPVFWSVNGMTNGVAATGTISTAGIYKAPLVPPSPQIITVTATSQSDSSNSESVMVTVVFGNNVLSGSFAFSTKGRVTNGTNAFFARAGIFTAGGGSLSGIEDTNQAGEPPASGSTTVATTNISFTGSYSVGADGRGTMQFCEPSTVPCLAGAATSFFRIVVVSPSQILMIDFSTPTTSAATIASEGEMDLVPDASIFNNQGLSGTYTFEFSGISATSAEESAVGEFMSNGHASISAGNAATPGEISVDTANSQPPAGPQFLPATTYSVFGSGRGTMVLNGLNFSFYMVTASRAKFIEIDGSPSSILVGDAYKQQSGANCGWGLNALNGATLFETSGTSSGTAVADLGSFTASSSGGVGAVAAGSIDENSGGTISSQLATLNGSYSISSCGRGSLSVGAHSYVFYPISTGSAVLQETTSGIVTYGFLVQPQGGPFTNSSLNGSYAIALSGTTAAGAAGMREDILGQLTSNGSGSGLTGTLDTNSFGTTTGQSGVAIPTGTYMPAAAGASAAGALRATMNLGLTPARSFILYLVTTVSPAQFFILDTDTTGMAVGSMHNQF